MRAHHHRRRAPLGGFTPVQAFAFSAQLVLTCSVSLLTHATIDARTGRYAYKTTTIPFLAEATKLLLSSTLFLNDYYHTANVDDDGGARRVFLERVDHSSTTVLTAAVPALMYFVSNNLNFIIIRELGATNFQLLNNLKILTTAIFFRVIMKVELNKMQWRMLFLLTVGCMVSQLGQARGKGEGGVDGSGMMVGSSLGYGLKLCNACLTALGSVFCEKFLKHLPNNFHFQNCMLYGWGVLFTTASVLVDGEVFQRGVARTFRGHSALTFLLICNYAFVGIATSGVMKYLDNIAKTFAATGAMFIVTAISIAKFGEPFRIELVLGALISAIAVDVYYHGELLMDDKIKKPDDESDEDDVYAVTAMNKRGGDRNVVERDARINTINGKENNGFELEDGLKHSQKVALEEK